MKNKKGFTLIELLAVIAILAIILVIATPQVIKSINNSRNEAFLTSYKNLVNEVKKRIVEKRTNKNIPILCSDSSNIDRNVLDGSNCSEVYDISDSDYEMSVLYIEGNYVVILQGIGKFENVDFNYKSKEKLNNYFYPIALDYVITDEEGIEISNNSLFTIISSFGETVKLEGFEEE